MTLDDRPLVPPPPQGLDWFQTAKNEKKNVASLVQVTVVHCQCQNLISCIRIFYTFDRDRAQN